MYLVCCFAFQDPRYNDDVDRIAGYTTDSLLCLPIKNTDEEIIGVAQVINKRTDVGHAYFLRDDEKVNDSDNLYRFMKFACDNSFATHSAPILGSTKEANDNINLNLQ